MIETQILLTDDYKTKLLLPDHFVNYNSQYDGLPILYKFTWPED